MSSAVKNTFSYNKVFVLQSGQTLPNFKLSYTTYGEFNADKSNVIWICHALTGDSNVFDWWHGLFGETDLFNPKDYFIICANMLGGCYGSTGPLSVNTRTNTPFFHDFPLVTNLDIVRAFDLLRRHLDLTKIHTLIGGSMGGQQALEWISAQKNIFDHLIVLATNAKHSPWGIAFNESQRAAISLDPTWADDRPDAGIKGLKAARGIAMLSYRSYEGYTLRQSDEHEKWDDFRASSYQIYQGEKLSRRFDAFTYWGLSKAMDGHHIGRNRGTIGQVLNNINTPALVIGINSDVLFPTKEQKLIANHLKNGHYAEISSVYGHDGFLLETKQITDKITQFYHGLNTI